MIEFASGQITGKRSAQEDALGVLPLVAAPDGSGAPAVMLPPADKATIPADDSAALLSGGHSTPLSAGIVFVVADGMGGHVGGRVASRVCVDAFLKTVSSSKDGWAQRLEAGLTAANDALHREAEGHPDLAGMGSTLVGAVVGESGLGWISIGDSALYLYRSGTLTRLNEDHSFGAYLDQQVREGLMTAEAAARDRRRNHLFYALLGDELEHFERFSGFRDLAPGDLVLLASDGLKTLEDERLAAMIQDHAAGTIEDVVSVLLNAVETEARERQDNASIIVARIVPTHPRQAHSGNETPERDAPTADPSGRERTETRPRPLGNKPTQPKRSVGLRVGLAVLAVVILGAIAVCFMQFR